MADTVSVSDPTDIYMWRRLESHLTTSGQPSEDQFTAIKKLGITHVVNLGLHTHEKALADEAGTVRAQGMTYIHIPVDFDNPTDDDFEKFRLAMRALEGNAIHIHCIANLRVSAFLYRYRRDDLMMPEADARAEMDRVLAARRHVGTFHWRSAGRETSTPLCKPRLLRRDRKAPILAAPKQTI